MKLTVIDGGRHGFGNTDTLERAVRSIKKQEVDMRYKAFAASVIRLYNAIYPTIDAKAGIQMDLMANINYYKKHGKLPEAADNQRQRDRRNRGARYGR